MASFLTNDDEEKVEQFSQPFLAKITNRTYAPSSTYAGLYMYDWIQQSPISNPIASVDASPCAEGIYTAPVSYSAAICINNYKIEVGTYVMMSYKCTDGDILYQFDSKNSVDIFHARLTTASGGKWKFYRLRVDSSGVYQDNGSESAGYYGIPLKIDGTNYCNPVAGLRVLMYDSGVLDGSGNPQYEFIPFGYAASGFPGLVSKDAQTISGQKTLENPLKVNSTRVTSGFTPDYNASGNTVYFQVNGGTWGGEVATLIEARQINSNSGYVYLFEEEFNAITSGGLDPTHAAYYFKCGGNGLFCSRVISGGDYRYMVRDGILISSGAANTPYSTASFAPNPLLLTGTTGMYMARYDEIICGQGINGAAGSKKGVASHAIIVDYSVNPSLPKTYDVLQGEANLGSGIYSDGLHRYASDGFAIARWNGASDNPTAFYDGMTFSSGNYYVTVSGLGVATLVDMYSYGGIIVPPTWSPGPTITVLTSNGISGTTTDGTTVVGGQITAIGTSGPPITGTTTTSLTGYLSGNGSLVSASTTIPNTSITGLGTLSTQSGTFSGTHSGTSSGTNTGDQTITLTGNITGSGTGSFATTIAAGSVTNAMLAGGITFANMVGTDINLDGGSA